MDNWDQLLTAFRALGGSAENIRLGTGTRGRGLFPLDESRPVLLRVPPNLLFPVEDIEFSGDSIGISDSAAAGPAERGFFRLYQNSLSWGGGGSTESAAYIAALDRLPSEIRAALGDDFGMAEFLEGDPFHRAQRRFLKSRLIEVRGRDCVMPFIELANHYPDGLPYEIGEDIQIRGQVRDEVVVSYGFHDPLSIFQSFGFASRERTALSLPVNISWEGMEISIGRNTAEVDNRGNDPIPRSSIRENRISLSFLLTGFPKFPKLPRGIFRMLMHEAGVKNVDEAFDHILHFNWMKVLGLLSRLESHEGTMIQMLQEVVRYQLALMTHCIGSRKPEAEPLPSGKVWGFSLRS
jgi:hypothetical protein